MAEQTTYAYHLSDNGGVNTEWEIPFLLPIGTVFSHELGKYKVTSYSPTEEIQVLCDRIYEAEQPKKLNINQPVCWVDFESTGTDTAKDRIVEMAFVKLDTDGSRTEKVYKVNPGVPIPKGASDVHGITDDQVKDLPTFASYANGILAFIKDCALGGFKSNQFDFPLLYAELYRAGIEWDYKQHDFIDCGNIFTIKEPRTLSAAYLFYCGKDLEGAHGAAADINATIDVFLEQISLYPDLPETFEEMDLFCNYGKKRLDLACKFVYNDTGEIVFNFGPHNGKNVQSERGFVSWMLGKDFLPDTLKVAGQILAGK